MKNKPTSSDSLLPFILEPSWMYALKDELTLTYLDKLAAFITHERNGDVPVYPKDELVFNALSMTPFEKVNVVIVGQDPYHGPDQAEGLCFSVPPGVALPPSLKNIFKELKSDLNIPSPVNGSLLPWTKQGVLLLNTTLTVRKGEPMSHHGRGWEQFTDAIIKVLCDRQDPIIFVLWGKVAQNKLFHLKSPNLAHHHILTAAHPSPFSAHQGFLGCGHFSKINELLLRQGKQPIVWDLPSQLD